MSNRRTRANGEGSIFPYRNGFAAYAWVTKPDGKRQRKYVYGKTREQTHEKWIALQGQARHGPVATKASTVAEYVAYWLSEVVEPNLAPGSYITYEAISRRYVVPGLGSKRLDKLEVQDVQRFVNLMGRTCQCCAQGKDARRAQDKQRCCAAGKCCGGVASTGTVAHVRRVLRAVLSQAQRDGLVSRNVASLVRLRSQRTRRPKAWSSEEARAFLESARAEQDGLYAAYVLVLVLGLRKGELLGLAWEDIDFDAGEVVVAWQLQRLGKRLVRRETKSDNSDATLPLPEICLGGLKRHRELTAGRPVVVEADWGEAHPVFTTGLGTPIEPRSFSRRWDHRCHEAGVRHITVHGARRTCATLLADLDVHPRVAMRILRHAQVAITMEIYTQASSEATREALKRLGEALDG